MKSQLETSLSLLLTVAAISMAGAVVKREWFSDQSRSAERPREPKYYPEWRNWLAAGILTGPEAAPVLLTEFGDLECSACKYFHERSLTPVRDGYGNRISMHFMHFPLPMHRFATAAAEAAECAHEFGRFEEFVAAVFEHQDDIGRAPWLSYAAAAGVADTTAYSACLVRPSTSARVAAAARIAQQLELTGTPTVFLNGWRFPRPPSEAELAEAVERVLAGDAPFVNARH